MSNDDNDDVTCVLLMQNCHAHSAANIPLQKIALS